MATFVLVPGAMHGAWCWDRVVPLLEAAGHKVLTPDLPGTGENRSIAPRDATLAIWADHVADVVRGAEAPVLLVGHSRGGHVIGEAAERVPDRIASLVYLTAILSPPGSNMFQSIGHAETPPANTDGCLDLMAADQLGAGLYNRCTPDDTRDAVSRLYAEPHAPGATPAGVTRERWGRVPRAYIECSDDVVLTLECQRMMQAKAPCDPVVTIDSDHSPFLCAPDVLAEALLDIARRCEPA